MMIFKRRGSIFTKQDFSGIMLGKEKARHNRAFLLLCEKSHEEKLYSLDKPHILELSLGDLDNPLH